MHSIAQAEITRDTRTSNRHTETMNFMGLVNCYQCVSVCVVEYEDIDGVELHFRRREKTLYVVKDILCDILFYTESSLYTPPLQQNK